MTEYPGPFFSAINTGVEGVVTGHTPGQKGTC